MKILLAGGAGFLGSHLAEKLIEEDHSVTIVDDLSSGLESNIHDIKDRVAFVKGNISEFQTKEKFELVINFASRASRVEWETYPVEVALSNSLGNNNLIKIALASRAKYIFASTSEVYGDPTLVPTPETYLGKVSTTGSRSPYDEGKRFGEALVKAYANEFGLEAIIIRFFNTFGPRMRGGDFYGRVIDRFLKQSLNGSPITVYGKGTQTRSFTYVLDSVSAVMMLLERGVPGEVYNVGSKEEIQILELANQILKVTKSSSEVVFGPMPDDDPMRRAADTTKLEEIGWSRKYTLEQGLKETVDSFLSEKKE